MGKQHNSYQLSAWTTGAGIAIGTNIDIGGVLMGAAASTITLKLGTATIMALSGGSVTFEAAPVGVAAGAVSGTSSGGSFAVLFRQRAQ